MLKENLRFLRGSRGFTQEDIAMRIGVTRQAYSKWEIGESVPTIENCVALSAVYGVTIDSLVKQGEVEGIGQVPPGPPGKNIWGTVTISERGQIVIPKAARDHLGLKGGSRLVVLSADSEGIALVPAEWFEDRMRAMMEMAEQAAEE